MNDDTPIKRRRGAQPGNQNARGNRGNPRPRPNFGNRGGKGAPRGNQYARAKARSLARVLLDEYGHVGEARAWLEAHAEALAGLPGSAATDPVDLAMFSGLTPESIGEKGLELDFGLFTPPRFGDSAAAAGEPEALAA